MRRLMGLIWDLIWTLLIFGLGFLWELIMALGWLIPCWEDWYELEVV